MKGVCAMVAFANFHKDNLSGFAFSHSTLGGRMSISSPQPTYYLPYPLDCSLTLELNPSYNAKRIH